MADLSGIDLNSDVALAKRERSMADFADIAAEKIWEGLEKGLPAQTIANYGKMESVIEIADIIRAEYAGRELKVAKLIKAAEELMAMTRLELGPKSSRHWEQKMAEWRQAIAAAKENP